MKGAFLFAIALSIPNPLLAQDYYVPVSKDLEPFARLPVTHFTMNDQTLSYELPLDLVGRSLEIQMKRDADPEESTRLYRGDHGTASCMGTNDLPACVITHKNLDIDPDAVRSFLNNKFMDVEKRALALTVATRFNANEPIGFLSRRSLTREPVLPGRWTTRFDGTQNGRTFQVNNVKMTWNSRGGQFILPDGTRGSLSHLFIHGNHMSGHWQTDHDGGWIDFTFSSDRQTFEGTWGRHLNQKAAGRWTGRASTCH